VRDGQVNASSASEVFAGLVVSARRPACCSYIVKRRFVRAPPKRVARLTLIRRLNRLRSGKSRRNWSFVSPVEYVGSSYGHDGHRQ